ncbi:hypothetical protein L228DRAFT_248062 [Xylona heveae TC161]|uniref:Uncharacterized protein n=1 Tax=Xylona heveae (strain CBS 132557 / TC161) TaxID=1328760 RepID=A0A165GMV1_XYLHT|nr:hypothetical protein L228DRAFT_248062 [Xylona heveae TC161]KZF22384.1 hypothetical protein L228DRAFT_248062 [Xylona heveae TC161]
MAELHVAIYESSPDDVPHWSLYTMDDYGNEMVFEALGSTGGEFKYNSRAVRMLLSDSLSEIPKIGRIEADVWPDVPDLLKYVPMGNRKGWNCQNWVMEAIASLKREGYLEENAAGMNYIRSKYQKKLSV